MSTTDKITKKDKLGRIIYEKYNDIERYVIKYYDNSNLKKIIFKLIGNTQTFIILNKKGNIIYTSNIDKFFTLDAIKIYNKGIEIKLPFRVKNEYLKILKERINLKK